MPPQQFWHAFHFRTLDQAIEPVVTDPNCQELDFAQGPAIPYSRCNAYNLYATSFVNSSPRRTLSLAPS